MRPKVTIKHGRLLEPFFRAYIEGKYPGFAIPNAEEVAAKVRLFRAEWSNYSERFFAGVEEMGFAFSRNRLEVHIVSATDRDTSSPLIMRSRYDGRESVSVLCHELLHNLFNDVGLVKEYAGETEIARRHVYVFAALEYLFREVLAEPDRLEAERGKSTPSRNADYNRAWEIVDRDGYLNILKRVRTRRAHERPARLRRTTQGPDSSL